MITYTSRVDRLREETDRYGDKVGEKEEENGEVEVVKMCDDGWPWVGLALNTRRHRIRILHDEPYQPHDHPNHKAPECSLQYNGNGMNIISQ